MGHRPAASVGGGEDIALGTRGAVRRRGEQHTVGRRSHARRTGCQYGCIACRTRCRCPCSSAVHLGGHRAGQGRPLSPPPTRRPARCVGHHLWHHRCRPPRGCLRPLRAVRAGARYRIHHSRCRCHPAGHAHGRCVGRIVRCDAGHHRVRLTRSARQRGAYRRRGRRPAYRRRAPGVVGGRPGAGGHLAGHGAVVSGGRTAHALWHDRVPAGGRHRPGAHRRCRNIEWRGSLCWPAGGRRSGCHRPTRFRRH